MSRCSYIESSLYLLYCNPLMDWCDPAHCYSLKFNNGPCRGCAAQRDNAMFLYPVWENRFRVHPVGLCSRSKLNAVAYFHMSPRRIHGVSIFIQPPPPIELALPRGHASVYRSRCPCLPVTSISENRRVQRNTIKPTWNQPCCPCLCPSIISEGKAAFSLLCSHCQELTLASERIRKVAHG